MPIHVVQMDKEKAEAIVKSDKKFIKNSFNVTWFILTAFIMFCGWIGAGAGFALVMGILFYGGWFIVTKLTRKIFKRGN